MENMQKKRRSSYCIVGFPHIILVDPEGKIVAKELRGDDLYNTVEKFVNAYKITTGFPAISNWLLWKSVRWIGYPSSTATCRPNMRINPCRLVVLCGKVGIDPIR